LRNHYVEFTLALAIDWSDMTSTKTDVGEYRQGTAR
jgi:hypothetical protein